MALLILWELVNKRWDPPIWRVNHNLQDVSYWDIRLGLAPLFRKSRP
jgi:hypothetical protein